MNIKSRLTLILSLIIVLTAAVAFLGNYSETLAFGEQVYTLRTESTISNSFNQDCWINYGDTVGSYNVYRLNSSYGSSNLAKNQFGYYLMSGNCRNNVYANGGQGGYYYGTVPTPINPPPTNGTPTIVYATSTPCGIKILWSSSQGSKFLLSRATNSAFTQNVTYINISNASPEFRGMSTGVNYYIYTDTAAQAGVAYYYRINAGAGTSPVVSGTFMNPALSLSGNYAFHSDFASGGSSGANSCPFVQPVFNGAIFASQNNSCTNHTVSWSPAQAAGDVYNEPYENYDFLNVNYGVSSGLYSTYTSYSSSANLRVNKTAAVSYKVYRYLCPSDNPYGSSCTFALATSSVSAVDTNGRLSATIDDLSYAPPAGTFVDSYAITSVNQYGAESDPAYYGNSISGIAQPACQANCLDASTLSASSTYLFSNANTNLTLGWSTSSNSLIQTQDQLVGEKWYVKPTNESKYVTLSNTSSQYLQSTGAQDMTLSCQRDTSANVQNNYLVQPVWCDLVNPDGNGEYNTGFSGYSTLSSYIGFDINGVASSTNDSQKWCVADSIAGDGSYELINKNTQYSLKPVPTADSDGYTYIPQTTDRSSIWGFRSDFSYGYQSDNSSSWTMTATSTATGSCTGPDGAIIPNASSTIYYKNAGSCDCSGESEVRTCKNGVLSGSNVQPSCSAYCNGPSSLCIANGITSTFYKTNTSNSCSSQAEDRTCTNGVLSGTAQYLGCSLPTSTSTKVTVNTFKFDQLFIASGGTCKLDYSITAPDDETCVISGGGNTFSVNVKAGQTTTGTQTMYGVSGTASYTLSCDSGQTVSAKTKCTVVPHFKEI